MLELIKVCTVNLVLIKAFRFSAENYRKIGNVPLY